MNIVKVVVLTLAFSLLGAIAVSAQTPPAPTDRTKATVFSAADLAAALAKLPSDRPSSAVRVFSLAPYNVNVERRLPRPQGASLHEAQAELFYVIEGSATLLTGGTLVSPTRNGGRHPRTVRVHPQSDVHQPRRFLPRRDVPDEYLVASALSPGRDRGDRSCSDCA